MKIEEVRTSFTIYIIASELARFDGVAESLGLAGYMVATFSELSPAFSEFYSNPPHFLVFDLEEKRFDVTKTIQQVTAQLPESHVFLFTPVAKRVQAMPYLELGVYDLILMPLASPQELVRTMDRAAERDYFMYLNERLMQEAQAQPSAPPPQVEPLQVESSVEENIHLEFARHLFAQASSDECVGAFMASVEQILGPIPLVYFKYVANRRVLLASHGEHVKGIDLRGLGINLNEADAGFRAIQLRQPMRVKALTEMVQEIFSTANFFAYPVEALGEILGVICFLAPQPVSGGEQSVVLEDRMLLLGKAMSLLEAEKRLHVVSTKDVHTDLLNRQTFNTRVNEEISRSRRTRMPVSLVTIAVDQYGQLTALFGNEEAQLVLRTVARILEKHSRINDILGRTGVDEFGLLLPHTSKKGAMIKAERLRKMLESADFSKVLAKFPRLTISLGVSEYPSLVRDTEELVQSADEALYQVRKVGNRTCVAKPSEGFTPDFVTESPAEKGP